MSTPVNTNTTASGATNVPISTEIIAGDAIQRIKLITGAAGVDGGDVTSANPIPVSNSSLPLPTGASTEATLAAASAKLITGGPQLGGGVITATTQRVTLSTDGPEVVNSTATKNSLASIDTKTPALGQALAASAIPVVLPSAQLPSVGQAVMASSVPVTIASNQSTLAVSGTVTTTPPSNASTNIAQVGGAAIAQGQAVMASSIPVVLASNQSTLAISAASLPLPTGAALETGGNLATIVTNTGRIPAQGIAAPSASTPVNLSNVTVVGAAASIAALNIDLITGGASGWYDAANFHTASIQIIGSAGITSGAITFEQTNDTTNAPSGNIWAVEENTLLTPTPNIAAITIAASTTRMFSGAITSRYVRVRVSTAFATANVQAVAVMSQMTYQRPVQTVQQATGANLNTTIASGTVTTLTTLTTLANGQTAHSAASTGSPLRIGGRVVSTLDTTLVQGDASDLAISTGQQVVTKDFATSENDWQFVGTVTTVTQTAIKAAGAASIRNFVTGITYQNTGAVATTLLIQDGSTSILSISVAATMSNPVNLVFPTPLRGTAATAINYTAGTTGSSVLLNAQGYQSF